MKLRDYPLMILKSGMVSWPPEWQAVARNGDGVQGELGILEDVSMNDLIANKIFIAMEHLSERHVAVLTFDDATFTKKLYLLLLQNIGRTIREIGDLDLSQLL